MMERVQPSHESVSLLGGTCAPKKQVGERRRKGESQAGASAGGHLF